jgi:ribonucleoside-diphosphate reductase alpha chain
LRPLPESSNGHGGHGRAGQSDYGPAFKNGNGPALAMQGNLAVDKVRLARLKGYEGDPCSECGQLTLIRSGACCKCDTCGASSGCS